MFKKLTEFLFGSREKRQTILWALIILVIALFVLAALNSMYGGSAKDFGRLSDWADFSKYQAVFLTNGQVYFGKVADTNNQTMILEDIYYLRSAKNLQLSESQDASSTEADNFSLVKLGNELHGPEDRMSINLSQVLFVEDLKTNSKVVEAIAAYERSK